MDGWMTALALFAGLALRVGLPLAVTVGAVWGLRRLDARWEAEGELHPTMLPGTEAWHCWEINQCAPERRAACPSYQHPDVPCWEHYRAANGDLGPNCLDCAVFRQAPVLVPAIGRA